MVSNFDAQFTEQQTDFLKEEENKKTKNKRTRKQSRFTNARITIARIGQKPRPRQENKTRKTSFQHEEKTREKKHEKNGEDSDSKSLLPENKDERGGRINFQKTKLRPEA
mmetsp:Transcript_40595/g.56423  ORF Transcript_40595/g.56423 Transcript_40595/m.56423 type:complete len:110 (-) Transcript_40595:678-1007(-)